MTITITESRRTRRVNFDRGQWEAVREFTIEDLDAGERQSITDVDDIYAAFGTSLPELDDAFPGQADPTLFAVGFEVWPAEDQGSKLWHIRFTYDAGGLPDGENPDEPGYVEFDLNITKELDDFWVSPSAIPTDGAAPAGSEPLVSGEPIDQAGHPVSAPRLQQHLVVREVLTMSQYFSALSAIRAAMWKRNNATFEGAATGYVLYRDAFSSRIAPNLVQVTHDFVFDEFAHLIQIPLRDMEGRVVIEETMAGGVYHAKETRWLQWFGTANFATISSNF